MKITIISLFSYMTLFVLIGCQKNFSKQTNDESFKPSNANSKERPLTSVEANSLGQPQVESTTPFSQSSSSCGQGLSGSDNGSGFFVYPNNVLNFATSQQGSTITINASSFDIPNRFTVFDSLGNTVTNTSWMGHVSYSGPWGPSLNTPETQNLTFTKDLVSIFNFRVETVTQTISDNWTATISCTAPSVTWINTTNAPVFHNQAIQSIDNAFAHVGVNPSSLFSADSLSKIYEKNYVTSAKIDLPSSISDSSYGFRNKLFGISYAQNAIFGDRVNFLRTADSMMSLPNTSVLITTKEKVMVDSVISYILEYQNGAISYSVFQADLASTRTTWGQQGFNPNRHQGDISSYVINIADSSIAYWNRYYGLTPQGGIVQVNIAPWLAADAVGALAGAIGAGLDSYLNTGSVNWKSVGAWALGGAVGASIPGTRWFKGFFKF